jgi:hypothetical protein
MSIHTIVVGSGAGGTTVPGGPGGEPLAVVVGRDVGARRHIVAARTRAAGDERREDGRQRDDAAEGSPQLWWRTIVRRDTVLIEVAWRRRAGWLGAPQFSSSPAGLPVFGRHQYLASLLIITIFNKKNSQTQKSQLKSSLFKLL